MKYEFFGIFLLTRLDKSVNANALPFGREGQAFEGSGF
jgi:hypothetical protein